MKKSISKISILGFAMLYLSISTNAQWTRNAANQTTNLTNTGDKVGIGTATPSYKLTISSGIAAIGLDNRATISAKNTAGTYQSFLWPRENDNKTYLNYGSAGFNIRNNSSVSTMYMTSDNKVGIGTTAPVIKLQVENGTDAEPSGGGFIQTGITTGLNVAIDNNEIMARYNQNTSDLYLNNNGGDVVINGTNAAGNVGIGISSPIVKLQVEGGTDASPASGGYIQSGSTTLYNVVIDENEIMARHNGIASGLTLNNNGGDVVINGTNAAGNVGIGVSAPTSRLHVAGNIFASGNIDITGHLKLGSAEQFSDGGANTIASNSNIVPLTDNSSSGHLGSSAKRWFDVWAVDGTINTSDARDKNEVKNLSYGMAEIMKLRPVSYKWISHPENGTKVGLIAQELKEVLPEVVRDFEYVTDEKSGLANKVPSARLGVMYSDIIPVLIKGMQEQQQTIEDLKTIISSCCENNSGNGSKVSAGGLQINENKLFQNQPNPFNQSTVVRYALNENAGKAQIIIRDINGNLVKSISLRGAGKGQVNINANELAQGTYTYSLEINSESVDTKLMVVTK